MTIISVPQAFNEDDLYVDLRSIFGQPLFLKCEGFNFAGSIKLKAAAEMVAGAERDGRLTPKSVLVESSSGNLGVALSMIAASTGYRFLCVTDSRCNLPTRLLMEALGSQVHVIIEPDATTGFLGARLNYLRELCASDDRYVWLDQYTNPGNWMAHYCGTRCRSGARRCCPRPPSGRRWACRACGSRTRRAARPRPTRTAPPRW